MPVKISVLWNTYRTGGVDVNFAGLAQQTFEDFEVIFIDTWYDMRKKAVKEYNRKFGIPLYHAPPFRDQTPLDSGSKHRNSAIALAEGELCLFMCDYGYAHPEWLQKHWDIHCQHPGYSGMGPHRYWVHPDIKPTWATEPISVFTQDFNESMLSLQTGPGTQDPKLAQPGGPIQGDYFHLKNEAVRLGTLLSLNGCDEGYDKDGGHCYSDTDMGWRSERIGNPFFHDPSNILEIVQIRDFYPFLKRNRTPADDNAYMMHRKHSWEHDPALIISPNDFNMTDFRNSILCKKKQYAVL